MWKTPRGLAISAVAALLLLCGCGKDAGDGLPDRAGEQLEERLRESQRKRIELQETMNRLLDREKELEAAVHRWSLTSLALMMAAGVMLFSGIILGTGAARRAEEKKRLSAMEKVNDETHDHRFED